MTFWLKLPATVTFFHGLFLGEPCQGNLNYRKQSDTIEIYRFLPMEKMDETDFTAEFYAAFYADGFG